MKYLMKYLKKYESMEIDISGLSGNDRFNNANPAIELEETVSDTEHTYDSTGLKITFNISSTEHANDILEDIQEYIENKYPNVRDLETDFDTSYTY